MYKSRLIASVFQLRDGLHVYFQVAISVNDAKTPQFWVSPPPTLMSAFIISSPSRTRAHPPGSCCIYQGRILNNSRLLCPAL